MNTVTWASVEHAVAARRRLVVAFLVGLAVLFGLSAVRPALPPTVRVLAAAHDLAAGTALAVADLRPVALPASLVPAGALRPGAAVLGRYVAGPVRRGEPLTDVRLVGPALLAAVARGPDVVAVPVRFADDGATVLLRAGDRIDVLAAPGDASLGTDPASVPAPSGGASAPGGPGQAARAGPGAGPGAARVVAADVLVVLVVGPSGGAGLPRDPAADSSADSYAGSPADAAAGASGAVGGLLDGTLVVVACSPEVARALAAAAASDRLSPALRARPP